MYSYHINIMFPHGGSFADEDNKKWVKIAF